jgi:trigger factor
MRVLRRDNSPTNITLTISGQAADLEPIRRHVLGHFKHTVKVPGFREGKAPEDMVEKYVNRQRLLDEFMEHALNELYRRAVDDEQIRPVSTPNVQLKKFVPYTELEFEAETEIIGPIKLPDYKKMRLAKPNLEVTAKDVNDVIKSLQTRLAVREPVDRAAKDGDELKIDFVGTDAAGKPVKGADGKDYPLVLGSQTFIPGFEKNLLGVKAGSTKKFDVSFPGDYGVPALRGKKVTFKVDVLKVQELKVPKADDDFAKQAGPVKNLAELKADIKKELKQERQRQLETEYQNELIRKISEKTAMEIPNSLVEEEISGMEAQEKQNLAYRGQTWQEHLKDERITEAQHRERQRPDAEERVKAGLILNEISSREGITVTPEEVEIRIQILKGQYQDAKMQAELDKPENRRDIESRLLTEKTLAKLTGYSSVKNNS